MPIPGARYRVKTNPSGKKVRLAFRGNRVVETKDLQTGMVKRLSDMKKKGHFRRKKRSRTSYN